MKIAITYEDGMVFQHFGHTAQFLICQVEGGKILSTKILDTSASGHGALAGILQEQGVLALICGGIGGGARMALSQAGIAVYGGVSGDAYEAAQAFADGVLSFDPHARCSHHDHGEGHSCGHHGGGHSCGSCHS